jgi:glucose-6-phosphate dehydrogenase assembly protein OpcA
VPVAIVATQAGTGLAGVHLSTSSGAISLTRVGGSIAELSQPGQPAQRITLPRRSLKDCLAEELRRLDPDEVFGDAVLGFDASTNLQAGAEEAEAILTGVDRWDDALVRAG